MPSAVQTSKRITRIILSAGDALESAAKAEQLKVFSQVFRWIQAGGKYELKLNKDGSIRNSGANFSTIQKMAEELGRPTSLNRIKKSALDFGRATNNIRNENLDYAKTEFGEAFKNSPKFNIPGKQIRDRVAENLRPEPYLQAFQQPIRDIINEFTKNGRDFFDLVERLQNAIAGVRARDPDGVFYQRGMLEQYYQAKRLTRDAMFGASRQENKLIAQAVGARWRRYLGSLIDDSRNECIRRVNLQYFTDKEIASWDKLPARVWPEKIPNVEPEDQGGGYNCRHDIRAISERRVPTARVLDSYRDGYLNKAETEAILGRRSEKLIGTKASPGSEPTATPRPAPPAEKTRTEDSQTDVPGATEIRGGRGKGALQIKKANLAKELGIGKRKTLGREGNQNLQKALFEEGIAGGFKSHKGADATFSGYEVEGMNLVIGTVRSLKAQYGYAAAFRTGSGRGRVMTFGNGPTGRNGGEAWARGEHFGIKKSFVNGGHKNVFKIAGEDYRAKHQKNINDIRDKIELEKSRKASARERVRTAKQGGNPDLIELQESILDSTIKKQQYYERLLESELKKKPFNQFIVSASPALKDFQIEAVVIHEFGHVLHDQIFGGVNSGFAWATHSVMSGQRRQALDREWKALYRKYKSSDWAKENLSEYGVSDHMEFFAENFTLYNFRPDLIPTDISEAFASYWSIMDQARETSTIIK